MSRAFTAVPGGKRTVTLVRQKHEAPRHLFRRGLWSLGRRCVRAAAMWRIKVAAAAAAKARRTRDAIWMMRGTKLQEPQAKRVHPQPEAREIIHPITSAGGACIVRFGQIEPSRSRCAKPFLFENRRIAGATPVGRVDESQSPTRPLLHVAGETVDTRVWRDRCAHLGSRSRSYRRHSVYCL